MTMDFGKLEAEVLRIFRQAAAQSARLLPGMPPAHETSFCSVFLELYRRLAFAGDACAVRLAAAVPSDLLAVCGRGNCRCMARARAAGWRCGGCCAAIPLHAAASILCLCRTVF
jgi:hypothetical protein